MTLFSNALDLATAHIQAILTEAIQHSDQHAAMIVADAQCPLAVTLTAAYRRCLPNAIFIDFDRTHPEAILAAFKLLQPKDLVVLVQSTSFRLEAFRIRVELFKQGLKVIEHPHLIRMTESECMHYINALAYDANYYRYVGPELKKLIDHASSAVVDSDGEQLVFNSLLEPAKLNIGDYSQMPNIGGQFPIGEVFTEAQNLEAVSGRVRIFAFGDTTFTVNTPDAPITLVIEKGRVVATENSTPEFDQVLDNIRADEEVWLRELGFGMNPAFTRDKKVSDIGTYERMCGIHLSLGAKHGIYKRKEFKFSKHHVDVFAVTHCVYLDDKVVYKDGAWKV